MAPKPDEPLVILPKLTIEVDQGFDLASEFDKDLEVGKPDIKWY